MKKIKTYNWQMISDGSIFLHYYKDNVKLCDSLKHNIRQIPPQPNTELEYCTACGILIRDEFNK